VLLLQVALAIGLAIYLIYLGRNSMMVGTTQTEAQEEEEEGDVENMSLTVQTVPAEESKNTRPNLLASLPNLLLGPRARFSQKRPTHLSPVRNKTPTKRPTEWV